jgi:hypothetical protein
MYSLLTLCLHIMVNSELLDIHLKTITWVLEKKDFPIKNQKSFRILIFGDSLKFRVGIDDYHRYSNLLEEMFRINSLRIM